MKLIYCRGGDKHASNVAQAAGIEYGTRYDYKPYGRVYMLDGGAESVDWPVYLAKAREHKPIMALTKDYFAPEQQDQLMAQIADLRTLGVPLIAVCPKFPGAVADIPADCVIAVSVPTSYAGFLPTADELIGRRVHLLGGHPDQIAHLLSVYTSAEIISADMNIIGRKAALGQFWALDGRWEAAPKGEITTFDLAVRSWINIKAYLSAPLGVLRAQRVGRAMYANLLI